MHTHAHAHWAVVRKEDDYHEVVITPEGANPAAHGYDPEVYTYIRLKGPLREDEHFDPKTRKVKKLDATTNRQSGGTTPPVDKATMDYILQQVAKTFNLNTQ